MRYIEILKRMDGLKVSDDETFHEVTIMLPESDPQTTENLVIKLTTQLLKGEE